MASQTPDENPTFFVDEKALRSVMKRACLSAASLLRKGSGGCLDSVGAVIQVLEVDPCTNAGRCANFNEDGHVECDASIMKGDSGAFGAVGAVAGVKNAIQIAVLLAKEQMLGSSLLGRISPMYMWFLAGEGARNRAKSKGIIPDDTITEADERLAYLVESHLRGARNDIFIFLHFLRDTTGWLGLLEEFPMKPRYGIVRVVAPLAGCNPRIDIKHPRWVHLKICPSSFPSPEAPKPSGKLKPKVVVDGRCTLAFRDEDSCKSALGMVLEAIERQSQHVE